MTNQQKMLTAAVVAAGGGLYVWKPRGSAAG
jgi:hypothetical protein